LDEISLALCLLLLRVPQLHTTRRTKLPRTRERAHIRNVPHASTAPVPPAPPFSALLSSSYPPVLQPRPLPASLPLLPPPPHSRHTRTLRCSSPCLLVPECRYFQPQRWRWSGVGKEGDGGGRDWEWAHGGASGTGGQQSTVRTRHCCRGTCGYTGVPRSRAFSAG